jgi:outer membrane immunogenic protein
MKRILIGAALSGLIAVPAMAADMPARMPVKAPLPAAVAYYNWTGFYVGGHAGYGWGDSDFFFPGPDTATSHRVRGFVGGAHAGLNWQINQFVLGIEGAVSLDKLDGSSTCPSGIHTCETDVDHFWRAGARAGFAFGPAGNWLVYGMGGFARAKVKSGTVVIATGVDVAGDSVHHHGWYGGGGIEYAMSPNFIIGVEAYHVSLGGERHYTPGGVVVPTFTHDVDLDFTVVQARASYKFNWGSPVVARY